MDKSHDDFIERWAEFVRTNPEWRDIHTKFINAQFNMANDFIIRLSKTPSGREKIIELYGIKNVAGYKELLGDC
ncbi:MAG: hypothetical protein WC471_02905 [Candidatus Woesearchaeota archaeon]